jgi:hypothetical protein
MVWMSGYWGLSASLRGADRTSPVALRLLVVVVVVVVAIVRDQWQQRVWWEGVVGAWDEERGEEEPTTDGRDRPHFSFTSQPVSFFLLTAPCFR